MPQQETMNCSSLWTFFARSEGYRQGLETAHNPKVVGSNPTPATSENPRDQKGLGGFVFLERRQGRFNCAGTVRVRRSSSARTLQDWGNVMGTRLGNRAAACEPSATRAKIEIRG